MTGVTDEDLKRVLDNDANGIAALLPDLIPGDVLRLQEIEGQGQARADVLDAINRFIDQQQAADEPAPRARTKKPAKQQRGEELPEHLKPDYSGPLSIDLLEKRAAYFAAQTK